MEVAPSAIRIPISRVRRATATAMSAYRPAAEKTTAPTRMLPKTMVPTIIGECCSGDDRLEGDDVPELQARIDLPRQGGDAGRKRRGVPRDAHGDHDGIELRRGGCAIDGRRLSTAVAAAGLSSEIGDHADDLVPGSRPRARCLAGDVRTRAPTGFLPTSRMNASLTTTGRFGAPASAACKPRPATIPAPNAS